MNRPRSNARRNERDARTLDSPERRRTSHHGQIPQVPIPQPFQIPPPAPPAGPLQFNDPFLNNYVPPALSPINHTPHLPQLPVYQHLPPNLAQGSATTFGPYPRWSRSRSRSWSWQRSWSSTCSSTCSTC